MVSLSTTYVLMSFPTLRYGIFNYNLLTPRLTPVALFLTAVVLLTGADGGGAAVLRLLCPRGSTAAATSTPDADAGADGDGCSGANSPAILGLVACTLVHRVAVEA